MTELRVAYNLVWAGAIACLIGSVAHAGDLESYLTGELTKLELLDKPVSLARLWPGPRQPYVESVDLFPV